LQKQQEAVQETQVQGTLSQRRPFPWVRTIVAFIVISVLVLLAVLAFLATGHIINTIWLYAAPLLSGLIIDIAVVLQWLIPQNPISWPTKSTQPQLVPEPAHVQIRPTAGNAKIAQTPPSLPITPKAAAIHLPVAPAIHIFHFNEPQLPNPGEFYGRRSERLELIHRTSIRASIAIDGEYRMGKSWLIQYLEQVAPVQISPHVKIGRLSATHPQCQTLAGFINRALEILNVPNHGTSSKKMPLERLAAAARDFKNLGIIPVLCIDEFAGLIGKPGFDEFFLSGLRSIAEDEGLVLITASTLRQRNIYDRNA
jgi:hypothetical protein